MSRKPSFPSQRRPRPRRPSALAPIAAAVIALAAACEPVTPPLGGGDFATQAAAAEVPAAPAEQARAVETATPETPTPPLTDLPPLAMSTEARGFPIVLVDPDRVPGPRTLIGLAHDQVTPLLGEPSFKRRDDPAQIWRYRDSTCILDVFLYRPDEGGAYRVTHVEVRGRTVNTVSGKDCFLSLLKTRPRDDAG